jgi:predicted dehydrogenase
MQRDLRAAVIGAGVFGRHHAGKYKCIPGVALTAIADLDPETRRQAGAQFGVPVVADWRDLLGEVDIVSICTPAVTHAEIVSEFLMTGAHVLVEKPIATDLDEADELIQLAADNGLVFTVGHQERYVLAKAGLFDRNLVPLRIECSRTGPWTGRATDVSVVLDVMIHDLDLIHRLVPGGLGEVRARERTLHGRFPDEVTAKLTFETGTDVELFASRTAEARRRWMKVVYVDGAIEIDFLARTIINTTSTTLKPLDLNDPLAESVSAFVDSVREGLEALVRPEEARRALETALQIEEAAAPAREVFASRPSTVRASA